MGFKHTSKTEVYKIEGWPNVPNVYFKDVLGIEDSTSTNPIVGSWFRIEAGPEATPPKYEYNEVGIVFEGTLTLKDENGQSRTLKAGDTFLIYSGSTIGFSTHDHCVAWKCGSRLKAHL